MADRSALGACIELFSRETASTPYVIGLLDRAFDLHLSRLLQTTSGRLSALLWDFPSTLQEIHPNRSDVRLT